MSIEIKVPPLPESVSDATLITWHKKVGEAVARDENLVDLETDKVVLEIPAPAPGVVQEIKVQDGAIVSAGDVLAVLQEGSAAEGKAPVAKKQSQAPVTKIKEDSAPVKTSPAVRRLLDEHDLDKSIVIGTGKDGRITKADVLAFLKSDDSSNVTPGDPAPAISDDSATLGLERTEQRVPMTRLR